MSSDRAESVLANFQRDTANHRLEILSDVGCHRHLKFSNNGSSTYWFEIITWPGCLCISGDMGTYVFRRVEDMFRFFRSDSGRINPHYWSEKVEAEDRCDGTKEFSKKLAEAALWSHVDDIIEGREMPEDAAREFREAVADEINFEDGEHLFMASVNDFEYEYKYDGDTLTFTDFWEHDLKDYTRRFLWCCHAIVWAIRQYDAAKEGGTK